MVTALAKITTHAWLAQSLKLLPKTASLSVELFYHRFLQEPVLVI